VIQHCTLVAIDNNICFDGCKNPNNFYWYYRNIHKFPLHLDHRLKVQSYSLCHQLWRSLICINHSFSKLLHLVSKFHSNRDLLPREVRSLFFMH